MFICIKTVPELTLGSGERKFLRWRLAIAIGMVQGASNLPPLDRRRVIPSLAPGCSSVLSQQLSSEMGRSQGRKTAMENSLGV